MTTKEILIAARAKVAQGWTQGRYARTDRGEQIDSASCAATCWCAEGALMAVNHGVSHEPARTAIKQVLGQVGLHGPDVIVLWNDTHGRTQAEVLAAFDKAIEAAS